MLEKYIVCDACGLRSPSLESSGVFYITPTYASFMQELIMQGMQQKIEKSCSRCKNSTWHDEINYILQPPNYFIIVVNRYRNINNNFIKDRCPIPMDMTVELGLHKFRLQATIDHRGPSMHSGHYTASINCCKKYIPKTAILRSLKRLIPKNSSTAHVVGINWLHNFTPITLLPWRWHIISTPLKASRGISAKTCGLDDVFPPDDLVLACVLHLLYTYHTL